MDPNLMADQEAAASFAAVAQTELHDLAKPPSLLDRFVIRALDVAVSSVALLVLSPLLAVIAVMIKRDSPGPVLFRHKRVGINRRLREESTPSTSEQRTLHGSGTPFMLYKFRTMKDDARDQYPELYKYEYEDHELASLPIKVLVSRRRDPSQVGPADSLEQGDVDDPRVTRIGRLLRRTSLDELPNLLNVLIGDMHLVGPRPDIEENIRYYDPAHLAIFSVKPGMTGLAQIMGRGKLSLVRTNECDLEYVSRRTLWLDLKIMLQTIPSILRKDGAF